VASHTGEREEQCQQRRSCLTRPWGALERRARQRARENERARQRARENERARGRRERVSASLTQHEDTCALCIDQQAHDCHTTLIARDRSAMMLPT
jgi:hypothetical protein